MKLKSLKNEKFEVLTKDSILNVWGGRRVRTGGADGVMINGKSHDTDFDEKVYDDDTKKYAITLFTLCDGTVLRMIETL